MTSPLRVDIWSDIACPWCYIGKRRFERAVEQFSDDDKQVDVTFHSFELAPDTPVDFEGSEVDFLAGHKGMAADQVETMLDRVTQVAASAGLDYNFDILRHTRTFTAHELLHYAKTQGRQHEMLERLMRAYFTEGRHVGRIDDLADLAAEVGLDRDEVVRVLTDQTHRNDVRADVQRAAALGIQGVPFFVIDDQYGVSGAQETETFAQVLDQVWNQREEAAS